MNVLIALLLALVAAIGHATLPACPTEDSTNCYWDGGQNGTGHSFITIGPEDNRITVILD